MTPYLVGFGSALAAAIFAHVVGFDRGRSFYPTVLTVIACIYGLFAVMGGSMHALVWESVVGSGFILVAVWGFKRSPWLTVAGLAGHGVFDFFHGGLIANPGMPVYWPAFCGTYDVAAAVFLAWLMRRGNIATEN